jgi:hypothetical protein
MLVPYAQAKLRVKRNDGFDLKLFAPAEKYSVGTVNDPRFYSVQSRGVIQCGRHFLGN